MYLQNTFWFTLGTGKKDLVLIYNTFSNVILQYKFAIAVMYILLCTYQITRIKQSSWYYYS